MPPLIIWAFGVIGAAAAARFLYKEGRRINAELHPAERPGAVRERDGVQKLERDPATGVYRPK
jgi:hypothetical protein